MNSLVDTSVLLQVARGEPGAKEVSPKLYRGKVSAIIVAEALNKLVRDGMPAAAALAAISPLCRTVVPFSLEHAEAVAEIRAISRDPRLSLCDIACLAVAKVEGLPVLTNDRRWSEYDFGVRLQSGRLRAEKNS